MSDLPIDAHLHTITENLRAHTALVIVAAPGAGKTTRVPPAILNALPAATPHVIMLQPRRVAARAAAQRIAGERGWRLGEDVGYHIRFEKRYRPDTRIRILTEAILTRMLLDDPCLENMGGIGAVILDEFHERNLHSDLALAFLREIQQTIRPDLRIIVMSATLDAQPVAHFLGNAPIIDIPGRTFPITITHRPPAARDTPLETQIARAIDDALAQEGDILIFLPGVAEIDRTRRTLASYQRDNISLLPLHGTLAFDEQQRALQPDPLNRRKIILATNIAETSLTIDGVRTVIDTGLARVASFDSDRGMDRLDLQRISKASAAQRAGRAGRQAPGHAFRLWSQQEHAHLADFAEPEIARVDLAAALLSVHAWGSTNTHTFGWFEKPADDRLNAADDVLEILGATHAGKLTDRGRRMLKVPAHPRLARLLTAAAGTPIEAEAVAIAAQLADDSRGANLPRLRAQFADIAHHLPKETAEHPRHLTDCFLLAYPDQVARRRAASDPNADPLAAIMVGNIGLRLSPEVLALNPALAKTDLFVASLVQHDARNRRAEGSVRAAVPLELATLQRLLPEQFRTTRTLTFDPAKQKVIAERREYYRDLLLETDPHGPVDPQRAGTVLAAALAPEAADIFMHDEPSAHFLARLALVRRHVPEHPWPALDTAQLQELLHEAARKKRSRAELTAPGHLLNTLKATLHYPLDRQLEELAPETLPVPSGSHIRLAYANPALPNNLPTPPILAVRLQELFGLTTTPRLCHGRVPVLLHLLSPGYKPIQITSDLASFWKSAYFEVRKDLRARYPKHKWPDDPLAAQPEAKGRRR